MYYKELDAMKHRPVPHERAWRDIRLSIWRKKLPWEIAANDVDMMLIEYSNNLPCAMIEYKMEKAVFTDESLVANKWVADKCGLPFFVVQYGQNHDWWKVIAKNDLARKRIETFEMMTEREYVQFLCDLRGYVPPGDLMEALDDTTKTMTAAQVEAADKWFDSQFGGGKK